MKRCASFILVALAMALGGCPDPNAPRALSGSGMDMFAPVAVRVHPLTRFSTGDSGKSTLEARIELSDQFGDNGKGIGVVTFELCEFQLLLPDNQGKKLDSWTIDLSTPQDNKQYWDAITRTYLFKKTYDASPVRNQEKAVLVVTLTLPNGTVLKNSMVVPLAK